MGTSRADAELPNKMAHLDIMETDEVAEPSTQESTSRVLRKRKPLATEKTTNRRVNMKPRKHIITDSSNSKQIEALYLNKKVKSVSQTLETIYEEPKTDRNNHTEILIGGRKVKRLLTFQLGSQSTKDKIKKRRAKIKKFLGKSFLNRKKIPLHVLQNTIDCLELDELPIVQSETIPPVENKSI